MRIIFDVGSSTVKVYKFSEFGLEELEKDSIYFKEGLSVESGLAQDRKDRLFSLIKKYKFLYSSASFEVYGTSLFRKLSEDVRSKFLEEFQVETGIVFTVVSHENESKYLERALVGKCNLDEPVLLINIGGGSLELVVVQSGNVLERHNIEIGVGSVISNCSGINDSYSAVNLDGVVNFVKSELVELSSRVKVAFYVGGELTYMQRAGYSLVENSLFVDKNHPSYLNFSDFVKRNKEIFYCVNLKNLEMMMPENPKWMHGARGCSAIAQAICEKYDIEKIVPSNVNMVDGIVVE